MKRLLETQEQNLALFVQRLVLALVVFPHGAQKLFGWFGGHGFSGTMGFFTNVMHLPAPLAFLVILGESAGAVLLAFGAFSRVAAFGMTSIMLGAILTSHAQHGFFMNWFGAQQGEGFEYHLLALALSVPVMVYGGGKYALDSWLVEKLAPAPRLSKALVHG
ncbi:DoxX family protein [Polyangium sp. 6x1]|uniref:DoxX family protein n=1 Tax=Polyangium sp. 6x1 TaxID=3042689 RepID=UPI0024821ED5|nr:DoxX family protein [Polyangium sp. 6x1]MDI1451126.1 DoxX family protein [Polyangium sp. 6x1]